MSYLNLSCYKFITLNQLVQRQSNLQRRCESLQLKGTILLSPEGINIAVVGSPESIEAFQHDLSSDPLYCGMLYKTSPSEQCSFKRLKIRLKPEIITFKQKHIVPEQHTVPEVSPQTLKIWLDQGDDVVLLDTRNQEEVALGKFEQAYDLNIRQFTQLPQAISQVPSEWKKKKVDIYCTGGIRCEKAGPLLEEYGFEQVFQLQGGILHYFQICGNAHYQGSCFVFDDRKAMTSDALLAE